MFELQSRVGLKRYIIVFSNCSFFKWLESEALQSNHKIDVSPDGRRFAFKPVYKIRDGKSLLRLLKQHDLRGIGGILLEEVQESLPHCEKTLKNRANEIVYITRPTDKKKILFYNDRTANLTVFFTISKNLIQSYPYSI